MLAVAVELLHGTFRGDPDGTANTGWAMRGEWPPAPGRLFAALVAADGTRDRCSVSDGSELEWLERLPPPTIYADPSPWHQKAAPRFVVQHSGSAAKFTHQEYVGRQGVIQRSSVRVTPREPRVVYSWHETPPPAALDALRRRAARVGYLGTSDSAVRVRVVTRMPDGVVAGSAFEPSADGNVVLNVPAPGDLRLLDRLFDAWRERGADVARAQFPALRHEASYRAPRRRSWEETTGTVVAWLRLAEAVPGRWVGTVSALFKQAVLARYQELHGAPPAVLHGHGFENAGYDLARFLPLPDVGYPRSRGRIQGLALWLPPGREPMALRRARDAALAVRRLAGRGIDVRVAPHEGEPRPVAARPGRWTRRSLAWVTAFPAVHERRGELDLSQVSRWCRHAGCPEPVAFRAARAPLIRGAVDLAPGAVNRPGRPARPYSHVELRFAVPVRGPVVVGAGRQRGFGLCVPVPAGDAR